MFIVFSVRHCLLYRLAIEYSSIHFLLTIPFFFLLTIPFFFLLTIPYLILFFIVFTFTPIYIPPSSPYDDLAELSEDEISIITLDYFSELKRPATNHILNQVHSYLLQFDPRDGPTVLPIQPGTYYGCHIRYLLEIRNTEG